MRYIKEFLEKFIRIINKMPGASTILARNRKTGILNALKKTKEEAKKDPKKCKFNKIRRTP